MFLRVPKRLWWMRMFSGMSKVLLSFFSESLHKWSIAPLWLQLADFEGSERWSSMNAFATFCHQPISVWCCNLLQSVSVTVSVSCVVCSRSCQGFAVRSMSRTCASACNLTRDRTGFTNCSSDEQKKNCHDTSSCNDIVDIVLQWMVWPTLTHCHCTVLRKRTRDRMFEPFR